MSRLGGKITLKALEKGLCRIKMCGPKSEPTDTRPKNSPGKLSIQFIFGKIYKEARFSPFF